METKAEIQVLTESLAAAEIQLGTQSLAAASSHPIRPISVHAARTPSPD